MRPASRKRGEVEEGEIDEARKTRGSGGRGRVAASCVLSSDDTLPVHLRRQMTSDRPRRLTVGPLLGRLPPLERGPVPLVVRRA